MPALARAPLGASASRVAPRASRPARSATLRCRADSVLIANTKGGGHAFLGLHLARKLVAAGHSVTILNDGEEVRGVGRGCCVWGGRAPSMPRRGRGAGAIARVGGGEKKNALPKTTTRHATRVRPALARPCAKHGAVLVPHRHRVGRGGAGWAWGCCGRAHALEAESGRCPLPTQPPIINIIIPSSLSHLPSLTRPSSAPRPPSPSTPAWRRTA